MLFPLAACIRSSFADCRAPRYLQMQGAGGSMEGPGLATIVPVISARTTRQLAEWPELPYEAWAPTMETLHMKLQVIGKIRLALTRREPQWANVPLYLTARGLTTSPIWSGRAGFAIDVDLIDHQVVIAVNDGRTESVALRTQSVADFYQELMNRLQSLDISPAISTRPSEVE